MRCSAENSAQRGPRHRPLTGTVNAAALASEETLPKGTELKAMTEAATIHHMKTEAVKRAMRKARDRVHRAGVGMRKIGREKMASEYQL